MKLNARVIGHELMGQTSQSGADTFVCVKLKIGANDKAKTWKQSVAKLYMSQSDAERSFPVGGYVRVETEKSQGELDLGTRPTANGEDADKEEPSRRGKQTSAALQ